ncbi:hypothetical protein OU5_P0415 (plasmid) [Pseudomonas mandelii JR-1]|uniref:Sel1 repeat family protein n=1 Tax=Pseudomonas mandelii JR-1 TaxID=1147786 RepID=A0A024ELL9_9PSED|nr:hypothetical protein OU5_P0415 [Pseudomonas mandelii JR-1]
MPMRSVIILLALVANFAAAEATSSSAMELEAHIASSLSQGDEDGAGVSLAELKALACSGDPIAASRVGRMYLFGNGMLARDLDRARSFLSAAAMRGVPKSAADLVVTIISSSRALDDLREAAKWIKVAQFIDGPEATETTTELLRLAAGSMDLTVGYQAGARWIQNYRNKGGVNENRPCTSS